MKTLRKEVTFRRPPAVVWEALTDPRALAEWLMPNDFEPRVGKRFRFQVDPMPGFSGVTECEVLAVDPPRRLVYSWTVMPKDPRRAPPAPMTLTWTLEALPGGDATRLVLEQVGIESLSWWWRLSMSHGWSRMMKTLLPRVVDHIGASGFTPGAITRRDYKATTVPAHFAK